MKIVVLCVLLLLSSCAVSGNTGKPFVISHFSEEMPVEEQINLEQ